MFKNKKYFELLKDDYKVINGVTVYRIKALIDFDDIKAGDLGGYIEKESNLQVYRSLLNPGWYSRYAELNKVRASWVHYNACVYGDSTVCLGGRAKGYSVICNSYISDDSTIEGSACISDSTVSYKSNIKGNCFICDSELKSTTIKGETSIYIAEIEDSTITDTSILSAEIFKASISDSIISNIKEVWRTTIKDSFIVSSGDEIKLTEVPFIFNGHITSNQSFSRFAIPDKHTKFTVYNSNDNGYLITSSEQCLTIEEFSKLIKRSIYSSIIDTIIRGTPINGTYLSEIVWGAIESV